MQLDWVTVSAQIINFLILVWLLKRFLYQPVIDVMARREAFITDRLTQAESREKRADEARLRYADQRTRLDREREEILADARVHAERETLQLMEQARQSVSESRARWQQQSEQEKDEFLQRLQHNAVDAIQSITQKTLTDLADTDLEERIVDVFVNRLKSLDEPSRQSLSTTPEPVHITTAFELSSGVRGRLTRAVHEYLDKALEIEYSVCPDLVCGVTLTAGGRRLTWNIADYLTQLAVSIDAAFDTTRALD